MPSENPIIAVLPGTFDPVTYGHLDLIKRAAALVGRLVVGVGRNPEKPELFSADERVAMIVAELKGRPDVEVMAYDGLTMEFVRSIGAKVILRGIRDSVDLRAELQAANTNLIVGDVETLFLMTSDQHALTSSTLIKQIVEMGGLGTPGLARLVPDAVLKGLKDKFPPPA